MGLNNATSQNRGCDGEPSKDADEQPQGNAAHKAINIATLEEMLQGIISEDNPQNEQVCELLMVFLDETAGMIEEYPELWAKQDLSILRRHAHSLKSSCAIMGAEKLSEMNVTLELSLKAYLACNDSEHKPDDLAHVPQLIERIREEFDLVKQELKTYQGI